MSSPLRRRRSSAIRRRRLVALIGFGAVVAVSMALPLALSTPPPLTALGTVAASATGTLGPQRGVVSRPQRSVGAQPAPSESAANPTVAGRVSSPDALTHPIADRIVIDRLGIDLPIVEGDGVDAPLDKAAHYPGSAWPGEGSNVYIYAHAQEGMFLNLWNVRVGDEVRLGLVDGGQRVYTVTEIRPETPWNDLTVLRPTDSERLTLQTSTSYLPDAPRFVVIATPAG